MTEDRAEDCRAPGNEEKVLEAEESQKGLVTKCEYKFHTNAWLTANLCTCKRQPRAQRDSRQLRERCVSLKATVHQVQNVYLLPF